MVLRVNPKGKKRREIMGYFTLAFGLYLLTIGEVFCLDISAEQMVLNYTQDQKSPSTLQAQSLSLEDGDQAFEVEGLESTLNITEDSLVFETPQVQWRWERADFAGFLQKTKSFYAQVSSLLLTPSMLHLNSSRIEYFKEEQLTKLSNIDLDCKQEAESLIDSCLAHLRGSADGIESKKLEKILGFVSKQSRHSSTSSSHRLRRKKSKDERADDFHIKNVSLSVTDGTLNATFKYEKFNVKLKAFLIHHSEDRMLHAKLLKAKAGFFSIKGRIMKQIKKVASDKLKVDGNHIYYYY